MKVRHLDLADLIRDIVDHLEPVELEDVERDLKNIHAPPLCQTLVKSIVQSVQRRSLDCEIAVDTDSRVDSAALVAPDGALNLQNATLQFDDSMRDKCMSIEAALNTLSISDRRLIVQYYFKDYSLEQISKQLQLPLPVLKNQFFQARQNLADALTKVEYTA